MVRQRMDSFVCAFGVDPGSSWAKATFSAMAIREEPCCFNCRGEIHPRCSEEGESVAAQGIPVGVQLEQCQQFVARCEKRVAALDVERSRELKRLEEWTDCGQPASRAPSRFFIRSGTIADASSKNWAKLGMHHARNVRSLFHEHGQFDFGRPSCPCAIARP